MDAGLSRTQQTSVHVLWPAARARGAPAPDRLICETAIGLGHRALMLGLPLTLSPRPAQVGPWLNTRKMCIRDSTKTFAMLGGALLSVTLLPMLMVWLIRGRILPEEKNPISRVLIAAYRPVITWVLRWRWLTIALAVIASLASIWPATRLGTEFMPTLNEGSIFYMPTSLPGMSVTKAAELVQVQDKIIKSFPEVASVIGKAGRAATATDPAPLELSLIHI